MSNDVPELCLGDCTIARNFTLRQRGQAPDGRGVVERTVQFAPEKGTEFIVMLLGSIPKGQIPDEGMLPRLLKGANLLHASQAPTRGEMEQFLVAYHKEVFEAGESGMQDYDMAGVELAKEFLNRFWPVEK